VQNVVFGLVTGSILAIASVGFALVRQTENFLNIAHGQLLALGAFVGVVLVTEHSVNIYVAGAISMVAVGVFGLLLAILVFEPVRERGGTVLLFTSIGLALVLEAVMIAWFGTGIRLYRISFGEQHEIGDVVITTGEIVIVALTAVTVLSLQLFLRRTRLGRSVRAVASNADLARVRGVSARTVSATVWFVSAALAAMAGVMLGVLTSVNTEMGWHNILIILAAAVLGGLGSIYGVLVAGLVLGIVMDVSALYIDTSYRSVVAFGLLVLVLLVRPEGIFTLRRRQEATV